MRERIAEELKAAMKARDETRVSTLRLVIAAIKDRDIAARGAGASSGVSDDQLLELFAKMIKQRDESAHIYEDAGRVELAERERAETAVIREFMPERMDDEATAEAARAAISATGAKGLRDMGKVMAALKADYAGRMDFAVAAASARKLLGQT